MKSSRIDLIDEFLVVQMNHWILFPIVMTIQGLMDPFYSCEYPDFLMWILCSLIPLALFWVRDKAKKFLVFLILHIVIVAFGFMIPAMNPVSRVLCAACVIGYVIYSISIRMTKPAMWDQNFPPVMAIVLSAASLYLQHYQGKENWDSYYVFTLIAVLGFYFISYYLEKYLDFLVVNASSTGHIPEKEMFASGIGLVLLYTMGGVVILLLSSNIQWLEAFLSGLKQIIRQIIRFIASLFPEGTSEIVVPITEEASHGGQMELPEPGESFWLWDVLMYIAGIVVCIVVLRLLFKGLLQLIRYIRARFAGKSASKEATENTAVVDVHEKLDIVRDSMRTSKGRNPFELLSPAERIRRLYKKRLLNAKATLVPEGEVSDLNFMTARECSEKLEAVSMADIYEKVRYSKEEAVGEDVRRMKEACKPHK